ncbi:MAG: PAS domain S-box protein [Endomicrobiales bacterium]|nr:PAS domain S-box protein [Endomicrobiales bacterium]
MKRTDAASVFFAGNVIIEEVYMDGTKNISILLLGTDIDYLKYLEQELKRSKDIVFAVQTEQAVNDAVKRLSEGGIELILISVISVNDETRNTIRTLRGHAPGVPIIILGEKRDESEIAAISQESRAEYIFKEGVNTYVLQEAVRCIMDKFVILMELEQYVRELMESDERFKNIIAHNVDAMMIIGEDNNVRFVNFAAEALFEKKADEFLGKPFEYPIATGRTLEMKIKKKNDDTAVAEMRVVETEWEGEKAYLASIRDVTIRRKAEEENLKLQKQLVQAEKLMSVGMLASGVAHEINNPLTIILGFTQVLIHQAEKDSMQHKQLRDIETATLRCKKIISQLLLFSQQDSVNLVKIDLNQIVDNSLDLAGFQIQSAGIKVIKDLKSGIPSVLGNVQQLEQALINILSNARDAVSSGGTITITTDYKKQAEQTQEMPAGAGYVELKISDTGEGIPQEMIGKVFDPFFTTKTVGKGTGLGLSVCKGIIDQHNGMIFISSEVNKGTTVKILLPAVSEA